MKKTGMLWLGLIILVTVVLIAIYLPYKDNKGDKIMSNIDFNIQGNEATLSDYKTTNPVVAMYIENYGEIVIELYPAIAPNTVNNFISLVKSGFYDNNTFHRLMKGFVLQGGDPTGSGNGGPGYNIKGEFSSNGFNNTLKHEEGIVSMARANHPDSAGSQFFIMLGKAEHLDGNYAAFGKVVSGMEIIKKIEENEVVENTASGKLQTNLILRKAIVDLKGKIYPAVEKVR